MPDFVAKAKSMMNAFPIGDPAELERYATRLDMAAGIFDQASARLTSEMSNAGLLKGPLAERMRARGAEIDARTRAQLANDTRALSAEVRVQARELRASQEGWKRRLRNTAARLEHEYNQAMNRR